MNNHIIIELCAEDRARLDRLATALENHAPKCDTCAKSVAEGVAEFVAKQTPAERPVEPAEAPKAETPTTVHPAEESLPWEEPAAVAGPVEDKKPAPTSAELLQKVIDLTNAAKNVSAEQAEAVRSKIKAIVCDYAATVSGVPEDKRAECMERLTALEG